MSLRCAGVSYKLVGLASDDFPPVVPASPASWLTLDAKALRQMLTHTSFAVSHDETRYALNGVLFVFQGKDVRMVATDGHRLALARCTLAQPADAVTGIVPRKAVAEVGRVLGPAHVKTDGLRRAAGEQPAVPQGGRRPAGFVPEQLRAAQLPVGGHRPATPDSLPVIGASPRHPNVLYAFGHGHLGLTQAATTGRLVSNLIRGTPSPIDLSPYSIVRFS